MIYIDFFRNSLLEHDGSVWVQIKTETRRGSSPHAPETKTMKICSWTWISSWVQVKDHIFMILVLSWTLKNLGSVLTWTRPSWSWFKWTVLDYNTTLWSILHIRNYNSLCIWTEQPSNVFFNLLWDSLHIFPTKPP